MERYAILGWPVEHSRSPKMQEAGFRAIGIDATYELLPTRAEEFPERVAQMVKDGYRGWNVTAPHKERMFLCCDEVPDEDARTSHSVNTVVVRNGKTYGYSTDGVGVARALTRALGFRNTPEIQLYLGAGGATQAAAVYAARHGAKTLYLANRTLAHVQTLADRIHECAPQCEVHVMALQDAPKVAPQCQVLFQGTSLGLHPHDPMPIDPECLPNTLPIFDFLYTPSEFRNRLLQRGNPLTDGKEMLLQQGMESFQIWTNHAAPEAAMRQGMEAGDTPA